MAESSFEIASVLCPTDFSDFSRGALCHAVRIAKALGAPVTVLHVMPQSLMHPELFPYLEAPILVPQEVTERARERLAQFTAEERDGVELDAKLESGDPAHRVVSMLEKMPASLVVMGNHGRGRVERLLLGSVTERVVRTARGPVLTVNDPPSKEEGESLYPGILAAVDFSESSVAALGYALELWKRVGLELVVVHVVEPSGPSGKSESIEAAGASEAAQRDLEALLPSERPEGRVLEVVVVEGERPAEEIQRVASERGADLVTMGVVGKGALDPAHFGSQTSALMRWAERAVLTVRRPVPAREIETLERKDER